MANKIINQGKSYTGNFSLNYYDGLLVGAITTYAGDDIPEGYLLCDGSEVSRDTYNKLFLVIGEKYGEGNGTTTFNLPNIIDLTEPQINYIIKANAAGSAVNNATDDKRGFVRFATNLEAEEGIKNDVAITPKQFRTISHKVIQLTPTTTGTLTNEELQELKNNRDVVLTRNGIFFYYTSLLDGELRYSCVNKFTDGLDYMYTVLVNETTGEWTFSYNKLYVCKYPNVPPTNIANPSGVSGPIFYSIVNDIMHIQLDGVSVSSAGTIYIWNSFPSKYLPKQGKQRCVPCIDYNSGYTNCFFYINPTGLRLKAWRAGTAYWGVLTYHLDF